MCVFKFFSVREPKYKLAVRRSSAGPKLGMTTRQIFFTELSSLSIPVPTNSGAFVSVEGGKISLYYVSPSQWVFGKAKGKAVEYMESF